MAKITAIYKLTLPNIPVNTTEITKQRPITINTDIEQIKIYPPGYDCEKVWKRIQGKHNRMETSVSQLGIENADSFYILIEKDAFVSDTKEAETEYEKIDIEIENLAFKTMRLFRKLLPKTPIAIPNQLQYKSLCKCDSESQRNTLWSRPSRGNTVIYKSPEYYLNHEKWRSLKRAIRNDEDTELWEDFLYDANAALEEEDFNRAILYTAIGHEIFIKEYIEKATKEANLSTKFWKYLKSRQPRVLDYYDSILHLVKGHSLKAEKLDLYNLLNRINTARNNIVHEGKLNLFKINVPQLTKDIQEIDQVISWVNAL